MIITAGHWKSNPAGQSGGRDSRHAHPKSCRIRQAHKRSATAGVRTFHPAIWRFSPGCGNGFLSSFDRRLLPADGGVAVPGCG